MKEKQYKREKKGWRVKGKKRGVAGCGEVEEEKRRACQKEERCRGKRKQNTEYDYMEDE